MQIATRSTSTQTFKLIEAIAADSSKLAKVAAVKNFAHDEMFMSVVKAALDPFIRFGVKDVGSTIPATGRVGGRDWSQRDWDMLSKLEKRELSGNAARAAIAAAAAEMNPESAALLARVINKDLRADFGESTVNKAIPGFFKEFPYMRCSLPKETDITIWNWKAGIISQLKADGMFINFNADAVGDIDMLSRAGNAFPLTEFQPIVDEARMLGFNNSQTHGEMLIREDATGKILPREIGNGMLNKAAQGKSPIPAGYTPVFMVWDQIPLDQVKPNGVYNVPYATRFERLKKMVERSTTGNIFMIPTKIVYSLEEAFAHYQEVLAQGLEGTVIKRLEMIWADTTSKDQVKLKLEIEIDLRVTGFNPGKGKNAKTFGSIAMRSEDGLLEVNVSGFKDDLRQEISDNRGDWMNSICTVKINGVMYPSRTGKLHSCFLPRFLERRDDKSKADTLQRVIDQVDSAIAKVTVAKKVKKAKAKK